MLLQWCRFVVLTLVGVITFEASMSLAWRFGLDLIQLPLSAGFTLGLFAAGVFFLLFVVVEPIRIRSGQWRLLHRYPPLWLSVCVSLIVVVAIDWRFPDRELVDSPDWVNGVNVAAITALLVAALLARQLPFKSRERPVDLKQATEISWAEVEKWIHSGERAVEPDEVDFFRHRLIAERIVSALLAPDKRAISIIGPFGSGKSGVLNAVRARLRSIQHRRFVLAELNAWTISKPEDAPTVAIDRIIQALDDVVDTQRCRELPSTYARLASAEPSGLAEKLLGTAAQGDPIDQISQLDDLLDAIDARLVLFVEDAERAKAAGLDTRHLERLLWALGRSRRLTFVIAYAPL